MRRFEMIGLAGAWLLWPCVGHTQACSEPHYRWSEKIETSLATLVAQPVTIANVLASWTPRILTSKDKCAPRAGREDSVYSVTGWVRRIKTLENDGDWHVELTAQPTSPVGSCIVVEIPADSLGAIYAAARAALDAVPETRHLNANGDLATPVELRFTGAAFYDGFHRQTTGAAQGHGRCNSSASALWEIHPVYRVEPP